MRPWSTPWRSARDGRATDAYSQENEFIARNMAEAESVSARKATLLNPTEEDETVQVLRRRLFETIDESRLAPAVDAYRELWTTHGDSLAGDATRPETAETFRSSYPLHPEVLATLTGKTATLGNFQRVRGHAAAARPHPLATVGRAARRRDRDPSPPHRSGARADPSGDRHAPWTDRLCAGGRQRRGRGRGGDEGPGPGDRRGASRRHGALCRLCRADDLHAHARLQRPVEGAFARAAALFGAGPRDRRQLHRRGRARGSSPNRPISTTGPARRCGFSPKPI